MGKDDRRKKYLLHVYTVLYKKDNSTLSDPTLVVKLAPRCNWTHLDNTHLNILCEESVSFIRLTVEMSAGWSLPFSSLLSRVTVLAVSLTWLRLLVAGVCERPGLCSLSVTDGHIFRSVRPGEAAGVSRRPAAVSPQLNGGPQRPTRFESWCRLLRRRQAPDPRLRPVAVVYGRSALPCLETKVLPLFSAGVQKTFFAFFLSVIL